VTYTSGEALLRRTVRDHQRGRRAAASGYRRSVTTPLPTLGSETWVRTAAVAGLAGALFLPPTAAASSTTTNENGPTGEPSRAERRPGVRDVDASGRSSDPEQDMSSLPADPDRVRRRVSDAVGGLMGAEQPVDPEAQPEPRERPKRPSGRATETETSAPATPQEQPPPATPREPPSEPREESPALPRIQEPQQPQPQQPREQPDQEQPAPRSKAPRSEAPRTPAPVPEQPEPRQRPDQPRPEPMEPEERAEEAAGRPVTRERIERWAVAVSTSLRRTTPAPPVVALPAIRTTPTMGWSYEIKRGDSLWHISEHVWEDNPTNRDLDRTWRLLYKWNDNVLGPDPDLIYPGQVIQIPADNGAGAGTEAQ